MSEPYEINNEDWKKTIIKNLIIGINGTKIQKEEAFEQVGFYYTHYAPTFLYKYYSDSSLNWDAVRNNKMWYSAPCKFNDVFDCDVFIDEKSIFNSILKMIPNARGVRPGSPMWRQLRQTLSKEQVLLKSAFNDMKTTTGISCLSETDDSLLMWAHYANNHKGMCVEYELLEINNQIGFSPVPIIYSEEKTVLQTLDSDAIDDDVTSIFIQSITSKSTEWSYEKEWRIIQEDTACGSSWDSTQKGALLDMIKPSAVVLGCMAEVEFEKAVYEYCEENKINLFKMEKDTELYRLNKKIILKFR